MNKLDAVVIAGGGLAGASAAFALRERGFQGRLIVVSEEQAPPYERPPLSKAYLRGESHAGAGTGSPARRLRGERHRAPSRSASGDA